MRGPKCFQINIQLQLRLVLMILFIRFIQNTKKTKTEKNGVSQQTRIQSGGFSDLRAGAQRERRKRRNAHYQTGQKGVRAGEHALFTAQRSQQVPGIVCRAWPAALFCTTPP